jgi:integrase
VQTYRQLVKTYIEPQLGHIPLSRLTAGQVQVLLSGLVREGKAPSSVHLVHNVLAGALNLAVTWGYLPRSPCRGLSLPPMEPKEPVAMDPGQMRRLLALAEGTRFHAPIVLGLATGLRRSELLGLRWRDVDTEARVLQVRQALKQAQGRPLELGPPKTRGSRRTVQLPEALLPVLARHRAEQARQRLQLGDLWQDQGLVFPAEDGNPWKPSLFSDGMRRLFRRAGLPEMTARNLRHSFATAVAPEVDMKTLAAILGHTGPEMTWRYVRASEAQRAKAAEATDRALRGVLDAVT